MNLTAEIILWSVSLSLAVIGLSIGIIAARSATLANKAVQEMISNGVVVEESQRLFFDSLKATITQSKKCARMLKNKVSYYDYSIAAANTRIHPIAPRVFKALENTEYKDITEAYVTNKKFLEKEYASIIKDFAILKSDDKIPANIKKELIEYHNHSIDLSGTIMKNYTSLTQTTMMNLSKGK